MDDKEKIMLDIDKIREKIKEIKILILSQEKMLDEIEVFGSIIINGNLDLVK